MATERYTNAAQTLIASGGYTAGSGTLNVDSTAAPFPQAGEFRLTVTDQSTGAIKAVLKCTAVASGTAFTVTAIDEDGNGAIDNNAVEGDIVSHTITVGGMDAILLQRGAGILYGDPNAGIWSNFRTPNIVAQTGRVHFIEVNGASDGPLAGRTISAPSTPYVITARLNYSHDTATDGAAGGGIMLCNSSDESIVFGRFPNGGLGLNEYNGSGAFSAQRFTMAMFGFADGPIWLRLSDDGTNIVCYVSLDGINFYQPWTFATTRAQHVGTVNRIGFGAYCNNGNFDCRLSVLSWLVT